MFRRYGYVAALVMGGSVPFHAGAHDAAQHDHKVFEISETRKVSIAGVDSVRIEIGGPPSLSITEERGRFDKVTVKSTPKRLAITARNANWFSSRDYGVTLTLPAIDALRLSGSVDGSVTGVDSDSFKLDLAGSVALVIDGRCASAFIEASGKVDLVADKLICSRVNVDAVGAVDVTVHAATFLDVETAGASSVRYSGSPSTISKDMAGAGSVEPLMEPGG